MKIYFERSGGFSGIRISLSLDTASLSSDEAETLQTIIEETKFFEIVPESSQSKKGADYFQYKIIIEKEGQKHTVETTDITTQASLRPLIALLQDKALKK
jgi:hypothetical protein